MFASTSTSTTPAFAPQFGGFKSTSNGFGVGENATSKPLFGPTAPPSTSLFGPPSTTAPPSTPSLFWKPTAAPLPLPPAPTRPFEMRDKTNPLGRGRSTRACFAVNDVRRFTKPAFQSSQPSPWTTIVQSTSKPQVAFRAPPTNPFSFGSRTNTSALTFGSTPTESTSPVSFGFPPVTGSVQNSPPVVHSLTGHDAALVKAKPSFRSSHATSNTTPFGLAVPSVVSISTMNENRSVEEQRLSTTPSQDTIGDAGMKGFTFGTTKPPVDSGNSTTNRGFGIPFAQPTIKFGVQPTTTTSTTGNPFGTWTLDKPSNARAPSTMTQENPFSFGDRSRASAANVFGRTKMSFAPTNIFGGGNPATIGGFHTTGSATIAETMNPKPVTTNFFSSTLAPTSFSGVAPSEPGSVKAFSFPPTAVSSEQREPADEKPNEPPTAHPDLVTNEISSSKSEKLENSLALPPLTPSYSTISGSRATAFVRRAGRGRAKAFVMQNHRNIVATTASVRKCTNDASASPTKKSIERIVVGRRDSGVGKRSEFAFQSSLFDRSVNATAETLAAATSITAQETETQEDAQVPKTVTETTVDLDNYDL